MYVYFILIDFALIIPNGFPIHFYRAGDFNTTLTYMSKCLSERFIMYSAHCKFLFMVIMTILLKVTMHRI